MYSEYVIQTEMLGENGRLLSLTEELEQQIDSLEAETIRLRKALKNQAGRILLCHLLFCCTITSPPRPRNGG
jgi:hypothetical protein